MLVVGALLTSQAFTGTSLVVALTLIFVARPIAIYLAPIGTLLTPTQRRLAAWFGIRGIGSVYYLAFAITHGPTMNEMRIIADAVLVTIVVSVLLHGSSATRSWSCIATRARAEASATHKPQPGGCAITTRQKTMIASKVMTQSFITGAR